MSESESASQRGRVSIERERAFAREERIEMKVHKRKRRWNEPDSENVFERGRESDAS